MPNILKIEMTQFYHSMQYVRLFKMVHDSGSMKRGSKDAKISACLYIACRQEGIQIIVQKITCKLDPNTIKFFQMYHVHSKKLLQYQLLAKKLLVAALN